MTDASRLAFVCLVLAPITLLSPADPLHARDQQRPPSLLRAAASAPGALVGRVTTPAGDVVPHAIVVITSGQQRRQATASEGGQYRLELLPPGPYRLIVQLEGFESAVIETVSVLPSVRSTLDLSLVPRTLDPSIPTAQAARIPAIDLDTWPNPWLTVTAENVVLRAPALSDDDLVVPIHGLRVALVDLAVAAWPEGRVVVVSREPSKTTDDATALDRRMAMVLDLLRDLGVLVRQPG